MTHSTSRPTVGVALVNWNTGEHTLACIRSLLEARVRPSQVVVFDNASTDGSADTVAKAFPDIDVVRSPSNVGFATGTNACVRRLMDAQLDFIWILNNDTIVDGECLAMLLERAMVDGDVGAATGKILYAGTSDRIWYGGAEWYPWTFLPHHKGLGQTDRGQYQEPNDVPFISGCSMLVRLSVLKKLGLFDERYFAYFEDADWCRRAIRNGIRLRYEPNAVLWHAVSASVRKNTDPGAGGTVSPQMVYLSIRNHLFLIRQHCPGAVRRSMAVLGLFSRCIYYAVGFALKGRWQKQRALWQALKDGFRTEVGSNPAGNGSTTVD
jgi:GT2 family glycosyltransferase